MYILLKRNETSSSHNVILMKVKSICNCIDHNKISETRYHPPPQITPQANSLSSLYANNTRTF